MNTLLTNALCLCGSNKHFDKCCGRFLNGDECAKTPEQLMRSRYTAHALGGYGEYLVSTWLLAIELGLTAESFAAHTVNWQKLEVLQTSQQGDYGEVEFRAWFKNKENEAGVHHEHSIFKRVAGRWYYVEAKSLNAGEN